MDISALLQQVKEGALPIEVATEKLKQLPYESLGDFAKIDHHRSLRSGFPEVIFCAGKSPDHLLSIYQSFAERKDNLLGTRSTVEQYLYLKEKIPEILFDTQSSTLKLEFTPPNSEGNIAICTGGTSDIPVAEEAAQTAEFFGSKVSRYYDIGVAGIHRIFYNLSEIREANCIIAVAGMEGALPGVLAGLVDKPVIAVPTSVGYGAHFQGVSPLLTMLNACAEGISVVNIDNGFGAAYQSVQINRLAINKT